jgi:hypothetical protein
MMILKGISRYTMEMIRVEPPVWGSLSFSMVVSIGLVAGGILMWLACGWGKSPAIESRFSVAPA